MDTKSLVIAAKARFNHNSAKAYLKEKYDAKLLVAAQGGLWKADQQTISFLEACNVTKLVMIDTFDNPVEVIRDELLDKLTATYHSVMYEWHTEWKELESKR